AQSHGLAHVTEVIVVESHLAVVEHGVALTGLNHHERSKDDLTVLVIFREAVGSPASSKLVVELPDLSDLLVHPGSHFREEARLHVTANKGATIEDSAVLLE